MTDTNIHTTNDVFQVFEDLGKSSAAGDVSLAQMYENVAKLAANGKLSVAAKNAKVEDDIKTAYDRYMQGRKLVGRADVKSVPQQTSKLRAFARFSQLPRSIDPIGLMDDVYELFSERMADKETAKNTKSLVASYQELANRQLPRTTKLPAAELEEIVAKTVKDKTAADYLKAASKQLEKAIEAGAPDQAREAYGIVEKAMNFIEDVSSQEKELALLAELQAKYGEAPIVDGPEAE